MQVSLYPLVQMPRRGLSLIELMVVLAIVALLAAILLPATRSVISSGQSAVCQSNLRQIWTAMNLYAVDNDRYPPSADETDNNYFPWYQLLLGHGPQASYNAATGSYIDGSGGANYLGSRDALSCPVGEWGRMGRNPGWPVSYSMTSLTVWYPQVSRTDAQGDFFTRKLGRASQWPLLMDGDGVRIFSLDNPLEANDARERFAARHGGTANVLMADGHVVQAAYGDTSWSQSNLNRNNLYDR